MKWIRNLPFLGKLMIIGMLPLVLLCANVGMLSFKRAENVVEESQRQVLRDTLNRIDISLNMRARVVSDSMRTACCSEIAEDAAIRQLVVERMTFSINELQSVTLLVDGKIVYKDNERPANTVILNKLDEQMTRMPESVVWTGVMTSLYNKNDSSIYVMKKTATEDGTAVELIFEMDQEKFGSNVLTKQKMVSSQTTFMTDRAGNIVFSDNLTNDKWCDQIRQQYANGLRRFSVTTPEGDYYGCARYNALTHWTTFTVVDEAHLFPESDSLRQYIVFLVLGTLAITVVGIILMSVMLTKPLNQLKAGMKEIVDRDFSIHLQNDRKDEFGELTDAFNYMVDRINELVTKVYESDIAQKNAELEALQAQINPHFLYNTLDSINWSLIERNEMDISAIVVALGQLMQYTMDTSESMVPLEKEYRYVNDYLMIQKNRLEDRLTFDLELEEGLKAFRTPKLILQPLVENAIKHDIESVDKPVNIVVSARREGNFVKLVVSDDGHGMTAYELARYRDLLHSTDNTHTGIGVRNVARRLQIHFNNACRFEAVSSEGNGLRLEISIPWDEGDL